MSDSSSPASIASLGDDDLLVEVIEAHGAAGVGHVIGAGERAAVLLRKIVLFGAVDACGECDVCRRGGAPVCPLARRREAPLPERVIVAARWVVMLDDGLKLPVAVSSRVPGPMTLAYTLYARSNLAPREPTVVVGCGEVTRYLVQILRAKGLEPTVVALDDTPYPDEVVRISDGEHLRDRVAATFAARQIAGRPWRVLAASADALAIDRATTLCGPRSQLTVVAGDHALPAALAAREVTIITVATPHADLVVEVAAMCVKGELVP